MEKMRPFLSIIEMRNGCFLDSLLRLTWGINDAGGKKLKKKEENMTFNAQHSFVKTSV